MSLKAAQKPSRRRCARRRGHRDIDGEGCGADAEVLTAEAMPSTKDRCQAGPMKKRAVTSSVRQRPQRRKPGTYLGRVCVTADGPVTIRRHIAARTRRIFGPRERKWLLNVRLRHPLEMPLHSGVTSHTRTRSGITLRNSRNSLISPNRCHQSTNDFKTHTQQ
jgi:hypothetical protein